MNDVDALLASLHASRLVVRDLTVEDYVQAAGGSFPSSQRPEDIAVTQGPAFSGFIDGQLAVVGGVQIPWAGVGHGWCMLTDVGRAHGGIVDRAVVTYLRAIVHDHRLRRVQTHVLGDFVPGQRWAERLGFHVEVVLRRFFGPEGEDMIQYVRFTEEVR